MLMVPDDAEKRLLDVLRINFIAAPLRLRLFKNDHNPTADDLLADYSEADFDGYVQIVLNVSWTVPITLDGRAFITQGLQIWTATGAVTPNDVYGYYVVDNSESFLLWAERFDSAPIVVDENGDQVLVTPSLTLRSEPP